jgi:hypothetical protein
MFAAKIYLCKCTESVEKNKSQTYLGAVPPVDCTVYKVGKQTPNVRDGLEGKSNFMHWSEAPFTGTSSLLCITGNYIHI